MAQKHITFSAVAPLLFLGFSAGCQILACFLYLHLKINFTLCILSMLLSEGVYLLNRLVDDDSITYPERTNFYRNKQWLYFISGLSIIGPIFYLLIADIKAPLPVFIIGAGIGVLYSIKLVPIIIFWRNKIIWVNLKEVPLIKCLLVAILWGGSALSIGVFMSDVKLFYRADILVLFLTFFIATLNAAIAGDMRDEDGDRLKNIKTIPTVLGKTKTRFALATLNCIWLITVAIALGNGVIKLPMAGFISFCIVWAWVGQLPFYIKRFQKIPRGAHEILIDSYLVVSSLGLGLIGIYS